MRTAHLLRVLTIIACSATLPSFAQEQTKFTRVETHSSSNSTVNSSSSSSSSSSSNGGDTSGGDSSFSSETIRTEKPSIFFVPKFKQRIMDLKDQITLGQKNGYLTNEEVAAFMERDNQLLQQEEDLARKNYPKAQLDELEKAITLLNGDLFKASNKKGPPPGPGSDTTDSANKSSEPVKPISSPGVSTGKVEGKATGAAAGSATEKATGSAAAGTAAGKETRKAAGKAAVKSPAPAAHSKKPGKH